VVASTAPLGHVYVYDKAFKRQGALMVGMEAMLMGHVPHAALLWGRGAGQDLAVACTCTSSLLHQPPSLPHMMPCPPVLLVVFLEALGDRHSGCPAPPSPSPLQQHAGHGHETACLQLWLHPQPPWGMCMCMTKHSRGRVL
jgi:hypothetical protein